jgi:hypothetical protein
VYSLPERRGPAHPCRSSRTSRWRSPCRTGTTTHRRQPHHLPPQPSPAQFVGYGGRYWWIGRPAVTQSAPAVTRGGGLVDHPRQQRCSNTDEVSQPRTLRSALAQDILRSTPAGPVRIETLLGPRGRRRAVVQDRGVGSGSRAAQPSVRAVGDGYSLTSQGGVPPMARQCAPAGTRW